MDPRYAGCSKDLLFYFGEESHSSRVNFGAEGLLVAVGGTAQDHQGWMRLERVQIAFALL